LNVLYENHLRESSNCRTQGQASKVNELMEKINKVLLCAKAAKDIDLQRSANHPNHIIKALSV
jgi:hypothetical protein